MEDGVRRQVDDCRKTMSENYAHMHNIGLTCAYMQCVHCIIYVCKYMYINICIYYRLYIYIYNM